MPTRRVFRYCSSATRPFQVGRNNRGVVPAGGTWARFRRNCAAIIPAYWLRDIEKLAKE